MKKLGYSCVVALCAAVCTGACQETTTLPTTPSALPADKVGVLTLSCPADQTILSLNGTNAPVDYPSPQVGGGQEPVSTSCTPAVGSVVPVGTVPGQCTASDGLGQSTSCAFSIEIVDPRLLRTRFLAFGDSLTAGETSTPVSTILEVSKSYPFKLQQVLAARYPTQTIEIVNAGLSGETAVEGLSRIGLQVDAVRPEVVLIMEGSNDVLTPMFDLAATTQALDGMIRDAQTRGSEAMIATVPPVRPPGRELGAQNIPALNNAIRSLAVGNGIRLVDVFSALSTGACGGADLPCIGIDNLHATAMGYEVMAQAFADAIILDYDAEFGGVRASVSNDNNRSPVLERGP